MMVRELFYSAANGPEGTVQFATTPRFLAGGGDPRRVTEVLRAAGWTDHSDPGYPHVLLASPDRSVRLTLEPSKPDTRTAWWRFHALSWYAHFGGHTPVEILAGFTDALLEPAPEQPPTLAAIREILASTGWSKDYDSKGIESALSPDGSARMGPHPAMDGEGDWPTWAAEVAPAHGGGHELLWSAWLAHGTPAHLVAAFAAQLVSTGPVYRGSYGLPHSWLLTQEPTTVQGEQLAAEHRQRLDAARATARKQRKRAAALSARSPATPATTNTPTWAHR
jgi:hypothetical protein